MACSSNNDAATNDDDRHDHGTSSACRLSKPIPNETTEPIPIPTRIAQSEPDEDTDASVANSSLRASYHGAINRSDVSTTSSFATSLDSALSMSSHKVMQSSGAVDGDEENSTPKSLDSLPPPESLPPPPIPIPPPQIPPPPLVSLSQTTSASSKSHPPFAFRPIDESHGSESPAASPRVFTRQSTTSIPSSTDIESDDRRTTTSDSGGSSDRHSALIDRRFRPSRRGGRRRGPARMLAQTEVTSSDESAKSVPSTRISRSRRAWDSDSEGSFADDPMTYRNSKMFPPRMPAAPKLSWKDSAVRSSAVNSIAKWVSHYENSLTLHDMESADEHSEHLSDPGRESSRREKREKVIERLWQELKGKRASLNELKTEMAAKRKELKKWRRRRDGADEKFLSLVNPLLVGGPDSAKVSSSSLSQRFTTLQDIRSEYRHLERVYEGQEGALDEQEEELNSVEVRFFSLLASDRTASDSGTESEDASPPSVPGELLGIRPEGPSEDLHPLYEELTATIGDLENTKEEYKDLNFMQEQHVLTVQARTKARDSNGPPAPEYGQPIPQETEIFLIEYPDAEHQMRTSITSLEGRVQELREICQHRGIMRKHMSIGMAYLLNPKIKYDDIELDDVEVIRSRNLTVGNRFSKILSTRHTLVHGTKALSTRDARSTAKGLPDDDPNKGFLEYSADKEDAIDNLIRKAGKGIMSHPLNRWLLHQLRLSPFLLWLLKMTFVKETLLKIQNPHQWQDDVLGHWWLDGASNQKQHGGVLSTGLIESNGRASSRVPNSKRSRPGSADLTVNRHMRRRSGAASSDIVTVPARGLSCSPARGGGSVTIYWR